MNKWNELHKRRKINSSLIPSININTILDLDLLAILNNPSLRHEIINSKSLQFKSLNKQQSYKTYQYWLDIHTELNFGCDSYCRLPILIRNIRDILVNLLESSNKQDSLFIYKLLNPQEILDKLQTNNINLHSLFSVIGDVLKKHCAPIRDAEIELFIHTSLHDTTKSLELFLQLLEVMKIDILNHQLIAHRPLIVQSAIDIEFQSFDSMSAANEISLDSTSRWLLRAKEASEAHSTVKQIFITATQQLIESYNPESSMALPETLKIDGSKFEQAQQYIDDLTLMSLLLLLARQTLAGYTGHTGNAATATSTSAVKNIPQYTINDLHQLKAQLYVILNDGKLPSPQVKQVVLSDNSGKLLHYNVVDLVSASVQVNGNENGSGIGILNKNLKDSESHSITMALVHIAHSVHHKLGIDKSEVSPALLDRLSEWYKHHYDGKSSVYHLLKKRLYDTLKQHLWMGVGGAQGAQGIQSMQNIPSPQPSLNDPCNCDVASVGRKMSNLLDFNYRVYEAVYARILYTPVDSTSHSTQQHHTAHKHITKSQSHHDRTEQKQALQLSQNPTIPT